MNDNVKKWVAALRSGEYTQVQGSLRVDDKFCCLGVACDLYAKENDIKVKTEPIRQGASIIYSYSTEETDYGDPYFIEDVLPPEVMAWLGLSTSEGTYTDDAGYSDESLIGKNDSGSTFEEIAEIIEDAPEGLFR